ncbi:condensation domain-containing protein [Gordonia liuliyuniae]|uniref:Condensation domain-containing protein n=1 Tax=Gordonia liuliyuniae TaxID=2911517 RepID=A0ABS9IXK8_9ACTN|nr:condensation domain-containing protein [Gordonia liuliyuniae]MCF8590298.1 condensation domain-containing protein [Gordonia liuliyuniae]
MDFLQILDAPVQPGGLVEWIPTVEGGLGSWSRDDRLTSHNHEQHLRAAFEYRARTQREGGRESWLGLSIDFDEPMSVPAVRAAMLAWIDRHEVLRTHVVLKHDHTERYSTAPGSAHLTMSRIGWYTETPLLLEQVAGSFDRATAPLHWPAYRFATVARADSFTLLFAADHSLVDGYSLVTAQYELTELYRAAREGRPHTLESTSSYIEFSNGERSRADSADATHPAVQTWREFLARHGSVPHFAPLAPVESSPDEPFDIEHPPQASRTLRLLDDAQTRAFEATAAAAGGNLLAGLVATLALAYHRVAPSEDFAVVMPRHTRNDPAWLHALGWFVGLSPVAVDVSDSPDLTTATRRAAQGLRDGRHGASLPFLRVAELLGPPPAPRFVVSFMDTRGTPTAANADAGWARVLRSHSYSGDEVYVWLNRTPTGLRMHSRYPAEQPGPVLPFLDDFAQLLASTAEAE